MANGVTFNGSASAAYIARTNRLIVRNTQDQIDLIDTIIEVGLQWMWNSTFEFGVGDMSFATGGTMAPHKSHKNGQQVDIRPLRKDQVPKPVTYKDQQYDRDATRLIRARHRNRWVPGWIV